MSPAGGRRTTQRRSSEAYDASRFRTESASWRHRQRPSTTAYRRRASQPATNALEPILATAGVSKTFPGVKALQRVDFRLFPGEIHTLMGQNGAGKSTLINVLTGVLAPDAGTIRLGGELVAFASPQEAEAAGVRTLYQEVNLCPNLSVAENIFAGRQPRRFGAIDWPDIKRRAQAALARLDVTLDVTRSLDAYPIAVQQMVAIARALSVDARVLILDEPTSSLDDGEVAQLFKILRHLKQSGIAILFVTHFIEQTYAISDRITVMRNGEREGEYLARDLPADQLVSKMVGHERMSARLREAAHEDGMKPTRKRSRTRKRRSAVQPFVELRGVGRRGTMHPIDLDVQPGQILGLAGLLGSGRTETARLLFGADRADCGTMLVEGQPGAAAFAARRGASRHGLLRGRPQERGHRRRTVDPRKHLAGVAGAARLVAQDQPAARA